MKVDIRPSIDTQHFDMEMEIDEFENQMQKLMCIDMMNLMNQKANRKPNTFLEIYINTSKPMEKHMKHRFLIAMNMNKPKCIKPNTKPNIYFNSNEGAKNMCGPIGNGPAHIKLPQQLYMSQHVGNGFGPIP